MNAWKGMKLGDFLEHKKVFIRIQDEKEYKLCRVQLYRRGVTLREKRYGSKIKTKKQQICCEGDFIFAEMDAKLGGYGFISKDLSGAIVSSHYYLFKVDTSKVLIDFLNVVIKTDLIQDQIKAKGSTNYASVRPKEILNFELHMPDIETQRKIANRYKFLDKNCRAFDSNIISQKIFLKKIRQQILQEKSVGTVKLKSHVTHLAERVNESTPSHRMIGVSNSDGITDLITNKKEGFEKYKLVEKHNFIYNPMRINVGSIGLYEDNATCITSPDYVVFKVSNKYPIKALLFFLKFKQGLHEIAENVQGSVRQRLYFENLCNINIPEFSSKDYKMIEDLFSNLDKLEDRMNQNKENAEILMQSFLAEVFKNTPVNEERKEEKIDWFWLKQVIGVIIENLAKKANLRGEMVLAKFLYFSQEIFHVSTGLSYQKHNFGPYNPAIKKAILGSAFNKDKFFIVRGSGEKQVYDLGKNADKLFQYKSSQLNQAKTAIAQLIKEIGSLPSKKIELLATVCKVIQDARTTNSDTIKKGFRDWKITHEEYTSKADKFTEKEILDCLKFVVKKDWDKELLKN